MVEKTETVESKNKKGKAKTLTEEIGTSRELYNFLFEACNIIRGPVAQDSFKEYITPLLYFKRISDVYDEETTEALLISDNDEEFAALPEQHRFVIPEGCHWDDVRQRTSDLGSAIIGAMRKIELANPMTLYGVLSVFSTANWSNKNVFSDEKLRDLIEHMSKRRLGNNDYNADLMGDAYEMLLKKFADLSKAKAGEFYTPRSVVRLLVRILDPKPGDTVYDPACGSGGMLIEAVHHMKNDAQCCGAIFGQEKNVTNAAVAKMNLFLHGANDFNIMCGDTLRDPKILQNERLAHFDCVIANPPFSLEDWGAEAWKTDRFGRNLWGTPSDSNGDFAWLQHMVCSMRSLTGRLAVVLPQGVLFRGGEEGRIREELVKHDYIEAIITLGDKLFYGTGLSPCLLILRDQKPVDHRGKVLMIDGSKILTPQRAQNILSDDNVDELYRLYTAYADEEDKSIVVTLEQIGEKDYDLSPNKYVTYHKEEVRPYTEVLAEFKAAYQHMVDAEKKFRDIINREAV
ncbi:MAG: type I restriction-modification system subunit M [Bacteroidales bacterium]|nr:type I restriction-modification system subunit M [Bacteroidales bacterium]